MSRQPRPSEAERPAIRPTRIATGSDEPDMPAILAAIGEAPYEWTLPDDRIRWGEAAADMLGLPADAIATGGAYAALVDPQSGGGRAAVIPGDKVDAGGGVPYETYYCLMPEGPGGGTRLWIEDRGRWFAGRDGRPAKARGVVRIVNERRERERNLAYLARHDGPTGLFNRAHLVTLLGEAIREAERYRASLGFLILSINHLGMLNRSFGFAVADQAIAAIAMRVARTQRQGDSLGRYSGSKIGLIIRDCDAETMRIAADRFLSAVRDEVVTTDSGPIAISGSMGGVLIPRHATTPGEAMARAEDALEESQRLGPGRFVAYAHSAARERQRKANAAMSAEMVRALNERRVRLAFQPVVGARTREPAFHEALIRLERPDGRLVSGGDVMESAERLGLARLLDHRALELALDTLRAWPDARLSLNVSASTASEPQWLAMLSAAIAKREDIASRLIIEITETAAIGNIDVAAAFVDALHGLGCKVAIDDFGAGNTSFRNLRRLAVDIVKIDGSFVRDLPGSPDDQLFVKTLIRLARRFRIRTVVEWVEDEETARLLSRWGADYIQGHLTGRASVHVPWRAPAKKTSAR